MGLRVQIFNRKGRFVNSIANKTIMAAMLCN